VTDPAVPDLPSIERTEIDGVPVLWAPIDGPRMATLIFRVGRADEAPHQSGISHLVEHLALSTLGHRDYSRNGFVSAIETQMYAAGTDAQLTDFLQSVVANLRSLPFERVPMERRILSQEADSKGVPSGAYLAWHRYGNTTYGLAGVPELGLTWLGADPIDRWVKSCFTRGNVALTLTGPPPPGLSLDLPDGDPRPFPKPVALPGITFPARADLGWDAVGVTWVTPRSAAALTTIGIVERRIRRQLRYERGLIYDVSAHHQSFGDADLHVSIGMDCQRDNGATIASAILAILDDLSATGPSVEEVQLETTDWLSSVTQSAGLRNMLDWIGLLNITGRGPGSMAELVDETLAVTPVDVMASARRALDTALLVAPPGAYDHRLTWWSMSERKVIDGRLIRPAGWKFGLGDRPYALVVGPAGVSRWWAGDVSSTVRYDECVAIHHLPGHARELWSVDGSRLVVQPSEWRGGDKLIKEIDAAVPREIVACGNHGIGGLVVHS
jgi:zinc protease